MGHICICCNANLAEDPHYSGCCCEEEEEEQREREAATIETVCQTSIEGETTPVMIWAGKLAAMSNHDIIALWDALEAYDPLSMTNGMFTDRWADLIYSEMSERRIPIFTFQRAQWLAEEELKGRTHE